MASEEHDDKRLSVALPAEVEDWLSEQATRRGETEADVIRRLLLAAHAVTRDDRLGEPVDRDDLEDLQGDLEAQREEFVTLLEDVRSRVIQVKRETDAKAHTDHDHDEYVTESDLEAIRTDLVATSDAVSVLEETVDTGFENFEEILDHLVTESEKLEERSTILAREIVDLREKRRVLADLERGRAEVERLKLAANRLGIRKATCEECGSLVDVALLTEPRCPDCDTPFSDIQKKTSIFGTHTLETGRPPALEGRVVDAVADDRSGAVDWIDGDEGEE